MLPCPIFGTWANFNCQSLDRGVYIHFFKGVMRLKMGKEICFLIILCRFLILFILSKYDTRSIFSLNRINSYLFTSFCQVTYSGFLKCERKCSSQHQFGIVLENVIIYKIILLFIKLFYLIFILSYFI